MPRTGPRTTALENFLFIRNVSEAHEEIQRPYNECAPYQCWNKYVAVPHEDPIGLKIVSTVVSL